MSRLSLPVARRCLGAGALAAGLLVLVIGCGPDYKARGVVKGKVTWKKKPLPSGNVIFHNANGITATAVLDPEGNYNLGDAPFGDCKVTVSVQPLPNDPSVRARLKGGGTKMPEGPKNPEASGPALPSNPVLPKEVITIDTKFADPETSGLKFKVEKGEQTFNIDL